jgi:ABC-type molybdate transport system ATPase subunit
VAVELELNGLALECVVTRRRSLELELRPGKPVWLALPESVLHTF